MNFLGLTQCYEKRSIFFKCLNIYRNNKNNNNRINMVRARSEFKTTLRRCRYDFDKEKNK